MAGSETAARRPQQHCHGILTRLAYRHAQRAGVNVLPLIEQAGLSIEAVNNQNAAIGVTNQIKFVALVADALGDPLLGFNLARDAELREIGLLYYAMASAETFGDALLRLERYIHLGNEGVELKVERGAAIRATLRYLGIARHSDQHQISAFILFLVRAYRHLTGGVLRPTRVSLMHRLAAPTAQLEKLLGSQVQTGAAVDQVEFPAAAWDLRITSADPYLHRFCITAFEQNLLQHRRAETSVKTRVENEIAALLPHGKARHEVIADRLGMSARTLTRRLAAENSSFADILGEMRSVLARRYIADRTLSISQIAWMLGYAEIGTFTRAYQRWTGRSPSVARNHL